MKTDGYSHTDLLQSTINAYRARVLIALGDPLFASQLVRDDDIPNWLKELAIVLSGDELRPALRKVIRDCAEYPHVAERWSNASLHGEMPDWFCGYAAVMARRKKWTL